MPARSMTQPPVPLPTPTTVGVEKVVTREVVVEKVVEVHAQADRGAPPAATAAPQAAAPQPAATPAPARPPATTFQDYTRQPFVATAEDAVSTFSLDTDRTSYQLALSWLQEGYEIEPDSVRAEEWINAFDYGYELPADDWGFAITSDVAMHPLDGSKHLVRIGFQAAEVADDRPLNVTLVLDASGSMGDGNRVDIARSAAEAIRQSLRPQDRVAVVHFTEGVIHDLTVEHTSPDASAVQRSIQRLAPHGSTNVQAGLNQGVRLADRIRRERPEAYNYVILMSDGVANVDATNPFAILESAYDRNALNPLRLITIGVGINNYNDVLLEQLAQHGNGWYRYLDNTGQAQATFSRDNWLALSDAVRGPDAGAGDLGCGPGEVVADHRLREPGDVGPELRGGPQGVRGDSVGRGDDRVLRDRAARPRANARWAGSHPGQRRVALGGGGDRAVEVAAHRGPRAAGQQPAKLGRSAVGAWGDCGAVGRPLRRVVRRRVRRRDLPRSDGVRGPAAVVEQQPGWAWRLPGFPVHAGAHGRAGARASAAGCANWLQPVTDRFRRGASTTRSWTPHPRLSGLAVERARVAN